MLRGSAQRQLFGKPPLSHIIFHEEPSSVPHSAMVPSLSLSHTYLLAPLDYEELGGRVFLTLEFQRIAQGLV